MIVIELDTKLEENVFKCASCCVGNDGSDITCHDFEVKHNFPCCAENCHHYIEIEEKEVEHD